MCADECVSRRLPLEKRLGDSGEGGCARMSVCVRVICSPGPATWTAPDADTAAHCE